MSAFPSFADTTLHSARQKELRKDTQWANKSGWAVYVRGMGGPAVGPQCRRGLRHAGVWATNIDIRGTLVGAAGIASAKALLRFIQ